MKTFWDYLIASLLYSDTGNELFDTIVFWSSFYLELAAAVGVVLLVLLNKPLRERKRIQDKLIFWECVLVFSQNVLDMLLVPLVAVPARWADYAFYIALTLNEILYLSIILQWLICVDYSLYYSPDHIRRRYRHAALPIVIVVVLDIIHDFLDAGTFGVWPWSDTGEHVMHICKLFIEIGYIATAIYLVHMHQKETREPSFLRLGAFIIPFLFGALFRFYDASFLGFGVILTYFAMKRRDRYIDFRTGFYNSEYLDYISGCWDRDGLKDGNAILVSSPDNAEGLAGIMNEYKIPECFIITMGKGLYVMLTGKIRSSAVKMASQLIHEAAEEASPSFEPEISSIRREDGQTMTDFAARIKESFGNNVL